jgi:hypothetical protein
MKITALEFADTIGRRKLASANGVGLTAVSNAVVRGHFPSSWYLVCKDLAKEAGIDCPPALFKMRIREVTPEVGSGQCALVDQSGAAS